MIIEMLRRAKVDVMVALAEAALRSSRASATASGSSPRCCCLLGAASDAASRRPAAGAARPPQGQECADVHVHGLYMNLEENK